MLVNGHKKHKFKKNFNQFLSELGSGLSTLGNLYPDI